jgi:hypothetical protein
VRTCNGHNPIARAGAATSRRDRIVPATADLAAAAAPVHSHSWQPVRGPHLRVVRRNYKNSRSGCVGISYYRADRAHSYFIVNLGRTNRKIRIETPGKEIAWRRALKLRADHELAIRQANAAIAAARERSAA